MDERPSRAHEPNDQGSHCSTLSLRSTRSARSSPCRIHQRLQLRSSAEDPKGPHPLRIYLQMLDFPARTIQTQSAPENAGTKHLGYRSAWLAAASTADDKYAGPPSACLPSATTSRASGR